jgi:hypothetical protein
MIVQNVEPQVSRGKAFSVERLKNFTHRGRSALTFVTVNI